MWRHGTPVNRKRTIGEDNIIQVVDDIGDPLAHDKLFLSMLTSRRHGLLRLCELTVPDTVSLRNSRKITLHHTVKVTADDLSFFLPHHKADRFYVGNIIIIQRTSRCFDPHGFFRTYLNLQDSHWGQGARHVDPKCVTRMWFALGQPWEQSQ
jgi:hypothetical protein